MLDKSKSSVQDTKSTKVHKLGNPGRPIVSSNSHPTERISHFVDYHLQPLVHKLPSFVKDTNDFLNKLLTIGNLPANSLLVTLDVSSQYISCLIRRFVV